MDAPLWTETHAPALADLPQPEVRDRLRRTVDEPMNLVVQGPPGVGKTAAVRALAGETHDDPDTDLVELNVADFFDRTKKQIREDPRFEHFLQGQTEFSKQYRRGSGTNKYKRDWSKRDMLRHVVGEYAGYSPASGEFKTILLDNAEAIREDFQHALRRVMERHHRTTQFVIATRQPSRLIPPIRSRCFVVPVRKPTTDELRDVLEAIVEAEGVDYDPAGLEFIAGYANGNVRRAVLSAQTTAIEAGEITMDTAHRAIKEAGRDDELKSVLTDARAGDYRDARKTIGTLLDDEGYEGGDLLQALLRVARRSDIGGDDLARLHRIAGEVDHDLVTGTDDRLHLTHLLTAWGEEAHA
ncbi:replication factor C small subunit 2 [Salinigranum rubrum]|uniref:Replication factor C small subunit n=1 Tax=Salinigranum rubrum TaxID=755307 RepID=A0A2I8VNR0_9EURY|nr:AAA family ATPase [Salinigranum rubrum]AUV83556.1 replication factor C small subunit 2 [Salinigranum rubrum]